MKTILILITRNGAHNLEALRVLLLRGSTSPHFAYLWRVLDLNQRSWDYETHEIPTSPTRYFLKAAYIATIGLVYP